MQTNLNGFFFPFPSGCKCIINLSSNLHVWSISFGLQMCLKEGEDPVIWSEVPGIGSVFTWTEAHAWSWSGMESSQLAALGQQSSGWGASQAGLQEPLHPKKPFPQGSLEQWGHPQPGDGNLLQTRVRAGADPPVNRPSEPSLSQHNRNERCRILKDVSTSNREISIWSAVLSQILPSSTLFPSLACINFFWQQFHGCRIKKPNSIGIIFYNYRQTTEIKILWLSHQRWGGGEMDPPGAVKGGLNTNQGESSLSSLVMPWRLGRMVGAGGKGRAEGTLLWGALCAGEMDSGTDSGLEAQGSSLLMPQH